MRIEPLGAADVAVAFLSDGCDEVDVALWANAAFGKAADGLKQCADAGAVVADAGSVIDVAFLRHFDGRAFRKHGVHVGAHGDHGTVFGALQKADAVADFVKMHVFKAVLFHQGGNVLATDLFLEGRSGNFADRDLFLHGIRLLVKAELEALLDFRHVLKCQDGVHDVFIQLGNIGHDESAPTNYSRMRDRTKEEVRPRAITGSVRRTTSKGDRSARPDTAMVTPEIGDMERAMPDAS